MTAYWGWVPNKTGAISFTQIGSQCGLDLLYDKVRETPDACHVVCVQNRTLKLDDSLFDWRSRLNNSLLNKEDTNFILSAQCRKRIGSSPHLTGRIICKFGKIRKDSIDRDLTQNEQVFEVTFRLKRNGMCGLTNLVVSENTTYHGEDHEHFKEYLISQSYMFLRDMVHRHKHHDPKSDTFLDIRKATNEPGAMTSLKKHISYNLGKMVIKQPTKSEPDTIQNSLGILAYLSSYQNSFNVSTYPDGHMGATKASLDAEYSRVSMSLTSLRWGCSVALGFYYFISKLLTWSPLSCWNIWNIVYLSFLVAMLLYMGQITKVFDLRKNRFSMELLRVLPYFKATTIIALSASILSLFYFVFILLNLPA